MIVNTKQGVVTEVTPPTVFQVNIPAEVGEQEDLQGDFEITFVAGLDAIRAFLKGAHGDATYTPKSSTGAILLIF